MLKVLKIYQNVARIYESKQTIKYDLCLKLI